MSDYTLFCTEEQVKKALKLRAPISEAMSRYNSLLVYKRIEQGKETKEYYNNQGIAICGTRTYKIPTAEQMLGWLNEQGVQITTHVNVLDEWKTIVCVKSSAQPIAYSEWRKSRKVAIIVAIDAALEYLADKFKI